MRYKTKKTQRRAANNYREKQKQLGRRQRCIWLKDSEYEVIVNILKKMREKDVKD